MQNLKLDKRNFHPTSQILNHVVYPKNSKLFCDAALLAGLLIFASSHHNLGGTIVAQPFGGFSPYGPPTAVLPPRGHPAYYPQPILYWRYPSPPVSPTTYYGPAPTHLQPNLGHQHQPALVSSCIWFLLLFKNASEVQNMGSTQILKQ
jgi:hypothetical protein